MLESQHSMLIELGHIVEGFGHVYQLILYNGDVNKEKVDLLLKNGDVFEKLVSSNNAFIPIEPLIQSHFTIQATQKAASNTPGTM